MWEPCHELHGVSGHTRGQPEASQTDFFLSFIFSFLFDISAWFNVALQKYAANALVISQQPGASWSAAQVTMGKMLGGGWSGRSNSVVQCYHDIYSGLHFHGLSHSMVSTHRERWPASEWPFSPEHACSWIVDCWYENEAPAAAMCVFAH